MLVDSAAAGLLDSCEYAIGGYCDTAPAYFASGDSDYRLLSARDSFPHVVAEGSMADICDMCGQLLPPLSEEHLRQKHMQV